MGTQYSLAAILLGEPDTVPCAPRDADGSPRQRQATARNYQASSSTPTAHRMQLGVDAARIDYSTVESANGEAEIGDVVGGQGRR